MNKAKRFLTMLLVAISVFVMAVPAFADTRDWSNTYDAKTTFSHKGILRPKEDNSACYLWITAAPKLHVYVQAQGGDSRVNQTSYVAASTGEYTYAPYVACRTNVKYSVHNQIYENGYRTATFDFRTIDTVTGTVSYIWSPDSSRTYTSAT